jgi:polysaccharide biosynthesis transport protein
VSQDIQLSSTNNLPMHGDYFPAGGSMGGPPPTNGSPLAKLHRLLRGRYPIVIVLGLIFGAVGGAVGYFSQKPGYTATGMIEVSPMVKSVDNIEKVRPMFNAFMRVQVEILRSPKLIESALQTDVWKGTGRGSDAETIGAFASGLLVDSPKSSNLINISFTDPDPTVAAAGVQALSEAYRYVLKDQDKNQVLSSIDTAEDRKAKLEASIREIQNVINEIASPYGTHDLSPVLSQKMQEQGRLQTQISDLQIQLDMLLAGHPTTRPDAVRPTAEEVAKTDLTMRTYVADRDRLKYQLAMNEGKMGLNHPFITELREKLRINERLINERIDEAIRNPQLELLTPQADGTTRVDNLSPDSIKKNIAALQKRLEERKRDTAIVSQAWINIQAKQSDLQVAQNSLRTVNTQLDSLGAQAEGMGRITIINDGSSAYPAGDKRNIFAAAGAMGGMAVPVGLMLLIGLMDSRLRYSDETDTDMSGITLLGILPNLPDRLSDPEQAATAAHCVHQIRTMLQINGASSDQSVFAVTSAAPGDGKTSLTLALGLSFAACGSRTLLIDCDLIGAGLTRRLGVNSETGILEAASTRTILEHIRTTEIADVAILPVGAAGTMHASTLSPNALRRIITEAKKHFDVIMIDTGPILGSIEASLVATVADGIVLTVARGQHRQIVEKSLRHLMSIGAKIAGVVFNRAQARDFERSLSNMSMRSVGLVGNVNGENRYGPLGRAVQGSVHK